MNGPISVENLVSAAIQYEAARKRNDEIGYTPALTGIEVELLVRVFLIALAELHTLWAGDLVPPEVIHRIRMASNLVCEH